MASIEEKNAYYGAIRFYDILDKLNMIIDKSDILGNFDESDFISLLREVIKLKVSSPEMDQFPDVGREENLRIVRDLYCDKFDGKYDEHIKIYQYNTIVVDDISWNKSYFKYGLVGNNIRFRYIMVGDLNHLHSAVLTTHENMHGLVWLKKLTREYNYSYNELLPRFMEKVCLNWLRENDYSDIEPLYNSFLNYYNRKCAETYIDSVNLLKEGIDDPVIDGILKYDRDMSYIYLISSIYSARLYECYINNPKEVMSRVDGVIEGNNSITKVLDDLSINLDNNDTIRAFQKTLR